jgi:hypothetical protein
MSKYQTFDEALDGLKKSIVHWDALVYSFWPSFYRWEKLRAEHGDDYPIIMKSRFSIRTEKERTYPVGTLVEECKMTDKKPNLEQAINLNHLTLLFSYLESLAVEGYRIKQTPIKYRMNKLEDLKRYLVKMNALPNDEVLEFKLAKNVRNAFVHKRGRVTDDLLNAYFKSRKEVYPKVEGDHILFGYQDYEKWHLMIVRIAARLEKNLKSQTP